MFISEEYVDGVWPTYERQIAIAKHVSQHGDYILPLRFDDSEVPGLPPNLHYVDARNRTTNQIIDLIVAKLQSLRL